MYSSLMGKQPGKGLTQAAEKKNLRRSRANREQNACATGTSLLVPKGRRKEQLDKALGGNKNSASGKYGNYPWEFYSREDWTI